MSSSTEGLVFLDGLDSKLKPALLDSLLKYDLALLLFSFPKALVQIDGQVLNVKLNYFHYFVLLLLPLALRRESVGWTAAISFCQSWPIYCHRSSFVCSLGDLQGGRAWSRGESVY